MITTKGGESSYKDLITLLKGPDYSGKILRYTAAQLKDGAFRPVAQFVAKKFKCPSEPVNPKQAFLGQIGALLCQKGENYEKALAKALGDDA